MTDHDKLRRVIRWAREDVARIRSAATSLSPTRDIADNLELLATAAESTLPKTKMVEVWRVEYAYRGKAKWEPCLAHGPYDSEDDAKEIARRLGGNPTVACIRVTGPHQQEVPA